MEPLTASLIGAGAGTVFGTLKDLLFDKPERDKQNRLNAQAVLYSPYTKMNPASFLTREKSQLGTNILAGAGSGLQMGLNVAKAQTEEEAAATKKMASDLVDTVNTYNLLAASKPYTTGEGKSNMLGVPMSQANADGVYAEFDPRAYEGYNKK